MTTPAPEGIRPWDFRRPSRIPGDRMRALGAIQGMLATTLSSWLTTRLREAVEVTAAGMEQESASAVTSGLPSPCNAYLLSLGARGGAPGLVAIPHDLAFLLAERSMGGTGPALVLDRPLTPLERRVVRLAVDRIVTRLEELWEPHLPLGLTLAGFESDPGMVRLGAAGGRVLATRFQLRTAELESHLLVALSWEALDPFMTRRAEPRQLQLAAPPSEERVREMRALQGSLRGARVVLRARVPAFPVPVRTLSRLKPGEVLLSGTSSQGPLEILLGDQHRFAATPGRAGPALAVELTRPVEPDSDRATGRSRT